MFGRASRERKQAQKKLAKKSSREPNGGLLAKGSPLRKKLEGK
jgi:hypothetical protein